MTSRSAAASPSFYASGQLETAAPALQQAATPDQALEALKKHVAEGLARTPKTLSSMYFYDDEGSRLFQQIMALPEYYPTRTEFALLTRHQAALATALRPENKQKPFFLLELGAGDGLKTKILLRYLLDTDASFTYVPVDISGAALDGLAASLRQELPNLRVEPIVADYGTALRLMAVRPGRKAVLFLGSNIGNFLPADRQAFLQELAAPLSADDRLLVGFDLQKDPRFIRAAYDDTQGVTAAFNLNLLTRLNRELTADFDLATWQHYTDYDPLSGAVRSFLMPTQAQQVHIGALGQSFDFAAWEPIHTENSYKFTRPQIHGLAADAGLAVAEFFTDDQEYFADVVLRLAV
ncbi:L-histidine N(alpha)-methyltransferase [Hymenobacter puniceus]|uniref:L-histidine N(alpha)-methyltransferase n=1 Tax=Hymenobacter sp. BT190 TaxID=2763505 RepID=UPI00165141ED|nr:L-histidine N(alpha)-methyltransferase [Hymenobacter sp. BT190]MBC6698343.1 L-histidine N(alpha)-methyltransferase [Hymenobacter sp. BT190]